MALKIRLQRHGAKHVPMYRVVVCEASVRRQGRFVEILGFYNPKAKGAQIDFKLDLDRVDYWLGVGAKPTETTRSLIRKMRQRQPIPAAEPAS